MDKNVQYELKDDTIMSRIIQSKSKCHRTLRTQWQELLAAKKLSKQMIFTKEEVKTWKNRQIKENVAAFITTIEAKSEALMMMLM